MKEKKSRREMKYVASRIDPKRKRANWHYLSEYCTKKIVKVLGSQCAKHSLQELKECLDQQWSLRTLTGASNVNK